MSFDNAKREALIAEGLSEGEADYLLSNGTDTEGLELPAAVDDASPAPAAAPPSEGRQRVPDHDIAAREGELRELRERNARLDERMRVFCEAMEQPDAASRCGKSTEAEARPRG